MMIRFNGTEGPHSSSAAGTILNDPCDFSTPALCGGCTAGEDYLSS